MIMFQVLSVKSKAIQFRLKIEILLWWGRPDDTYHTISAAKLPQKKEIANIMLSA